MNNSTCNLKPPNLKPALTKPPVPALNYSGGCSCGNRAILSGAVHIGAVVTVPRVRLWLQMSPTQLNHRQTDLDLQHNIWLAVCEC